MINVITLSVISLKCRYPEGHYTECRYAEGHYAECRYAEGHGAKQKCFYIDIVKRRFCIISSKILAIFSLTVQVEGFEPSILQFESNVLPPCYRGKATSLKVKHFVGSSEINLKTFNLQWSVL
jgi:hypothetical protein